MARRGKEGALEGTYTGTHMFGYEAPFEAKPVDAPDPGERFEGGDPPAADVGGTWRFEFESRGAGKGTFTVADDGSVTGTIIVDQFGDIGSLAGEVDGDTLRLSVFDGQYAFTVEGTLAASGSRMEGSWMFPRVWDDPFTATRTDDVDEKPLVRARLEPGKQRVTIEELDGERYRGKPVIVNYFSTWGPACKDELPVLRELYERHHDDGLEILGFAAEAKDDEATRARIEQLRDRFEVTWETKILAGSFTELDERLPPELAWEGGYPVTIYINRDGTVRAITAGFVGPAAVEEHERMKSRVAEHAAAIVASEAPSAGP